MWNIFEAARSGPSDRDPEAEPERDDTERAPFELSESEVPAEPSEATEHYFDALREVVDPELGINLVDLGLVYAVEVDRECVRAAITATTPACPMQGVLVEDAERALAEVADGDRTVQVHLVWEPKWRPDWMSERAREQLGGGLF